MGKEILNFAAAMQLLLFSPSLVSAQEAEVYDNAGLDNEMETVTGVEEFIRSKLQNIEIILCTEEAISDNGDTHTSQASTELVCDNLKLTFGKKGLTEDSSGLLSGQAVSIEPKINSGIEERKAGNENEDSK